MSVRPGEPVERDVADDGDVVFDGIKAAMSRAFERQVAGSSALRDAFSELASALRDTHLGPVCDCQHKQPDHDRFGDEVEPGNGWDLWP